MGKLKTLLDWRINVYNSTYACDLSLMLGESVVWNRHIMVEQMSAALDAKPYSVNRLAGR